MYQQQQGAHSERRIQAKTSGLVKSLSKNIDCKMEPIDILDGLSQALNLTNQMLLESSEIDSKENVKSILVVKSALRIECNDTQVVIQATSENGEVALDVLAGILKSVDVIKVICHEKSVLAVEVRNNETFLDEDQRLKSPSSIDILRFVQNSFDSESDKDYAVFLCGLFAFDFIASLEQLPSVEKSLNTCPDFVFYLAESLLVIDHQKGTKRLISNQFINTATQANIEGFERPNQSTKTKSYFQLAREFEVIEQTINRLDKQYSITHTELAETRKNNRLNPINLKQCINQSAAEDLKNPSLVSVDVKCSAYEGIVEQLKQNIVQGDVFQVVPSRTFSLKCNSTRESYRALKKSNPSPYLFYMQDQDFCLFGASPESALKYTVKDNTVLLYPIAGTRPRGKNADSSINLDLDARIEAELKLDKKEVAEHMMLVDLARNDIARISTPGSTYVPKLLAVDRYSQVMHLVSCVKGKLREDFDALDAYRACMNMGTLTGAPKIKATELVRNIEGKRRGSYGGAVGYLNGSGDMDTCIVIRSAFVKNGIAHVQAGAGIVYDSVPTSEANETLSKASAVINAVLQANQIEDSNPIKPQHSSQARKQSNKSEAVL